MRLYVLHKKIKIESINDFINFIVNTNTEDYYFRGEKKEYPNIVASAFRPVQKIENTTNYYNIEYLISEYYKEVGYRLSDIERENFIFFCQHHGIPTNLIDISSNILPSTYFACLEDEGSKTSDIGMLFLFNKKKTYNFNPNNLKYPSLLHGFIKLDEFSVSTIFSSLFSVYMKDPSYFKTCIIDFFEKYIHFVDNFNCAITNPQSKIFLTEILNDKNTKNLTPDELLLKCSDLNRIEFPISTRIGFSEKIYDIVKKSTINLIEIEILGITDYLSLLYFMLSDSVSGLNTDGFSIPLLPYFVVESTVLFDRMKTQSGSFFYQNYIGFSEEEFFSLNNLYQNEKEFSKLDNTRIFQHFKPDLVVEIYNKNEIMNFLNKLGINKRYLFDDVDTVAEYLVKKASPY